MPRNRKIVQAEQSSARDSSRLLESALEHFATSRKPAPVKDSSFLVRVTTAEHQEIKRTAQALGLTITDYVLEMHREVVKSLTSRV